MTHVKDYSIGLWNLTNFLIKFAASNDTCMDKHILEHFTASNDTCKNYSIGFWDITNFLSILAASDDTCMDKLFYWKKALYSIK